MSTLHEILVSWSPVGSDALCGHGPVTYNITVMPSHGMMMMNNDTVYNITGLNNDTNYTITVYATNNAGHGEPATVTVGTKPLPPAPSGPTGSTNVPTTNRTTNTIPPTEDTTGGSSSSSDGSNTGIITGIIGGIVAIIVVIIIVIIVYMVACHRKKDATSYKKEALQSHDRDNSQKAPVYDDVKEPQQSIPHQSSASGELYAVSLKVASKTSQQQVPLVEYAEVDNNNKNPQLHYYDEINEKNSKANAEQIALVLYAEVDASNKDKVDVKQEETPLIEYAQVDKSKKKISQDNQKAIAEYDEAVVEDKVTKVTYAELQNLPTNNTGGRTVDKDATTVYTAVI